MRVGLFVTCLVDSIFPQVGQATVKVLERAGCEVIFPLAQTCCGQMHINTGYLDEAIPLVRGHAAAFADAECDAIVSPSGSCVGSVKHQHEIVARRAGDSDLQQQVKQLSLRTYELSEFLVDVLGVTDVGAYYPHRVTYHPTCHSLRLLKVGSKPLALLENVRGIDLVSLPDADACCGFGGTFAVKNPDVSLAMLTDKITSIESTKCGFVAASDSSCLMQIGGGLSRLRSSARPIHLAEILASTEGSR
jgi:L-lactate dehydrogenase complex protein LldE